MNMKNKKLENSVFNHWQTIENIIRQTKRAINGARNLKEQLIYFYLHVEYKRTTWVPLF